MELPDLLVESIREEWVTMMAHPAAFMAVLTIGLMFGWAAAWVILNQRLTHHRELVDYYKEAVAGKAPVVDAENRTTHPRLVFPLLLIGHRLFLLVCF